ncbi:head GIN domain-containing protein [Erythrobacter sp. HA6-11]
MLHKMIKTFAPVAAIALSAALAGCGDFDMKINDNEGVPLAELDMSGEAPKELMLAAPDTVIVTAGDTLDIAVEGNDGAVDAMRFVNEGGTLGIMRESGSGNDLGYATVRVTMPAPESISIAGSGSVETNSLANQAEISIAGSGSVETADIAVETLEVAMLGSGKVTGSGTAERIEVSSAGSGYVDLSGVKTDRGEVSIAGSGDVRFASDGEVEASIAGSGSVYVTGNATCTISAVGSGKLVCEPAKDEAAAEEEVAVKATKPKKAKNAKRVAKKASPRKPRKAKARRG